VLLTTHYLEEAEALCSRVAMLRAGKVVALERTSDLLKAASTNVLRFKLDGALPREFEARRGSPAASCNCLPTTPTRSSCTCRSSGRRAARGGRGDPQAGPRGRVPGRDDRGAGEGGSVTGWQTLLYKEVLRFWKVSFQTVAAPVLTALLYLLIFGHVLSDRVKVYDQISYTAFLVPGLVMMSVLQNAFANSSSSLIQSKIMGSLVFVLLTPLSHWSWFIAYVGSSMARGLCVGLGVFLVTVGFTHVSFAAPLWILVFALLGAACWARWD
jgi:hypothetical protein